MQYINTGTGANAGNGDSIRLAFTKINRNFAEVAQLIGTTSTAFTEIAQDAVSKLFTHPNHAGLTATYDDTDNKIILALNESGFGYTGSMGYQGAQGAGSSPGTNGNDGAQGYQGYQGYQGTNGNNGNIGAQGYQGYQGTFGIDGVQGAQGTTGAQGSVGTQGSAGIDGAQGAQGNTGAQGSVGVQGLSGVQGGVGAQGGVGIQGSDGTQGIQGFQGVPGQGNQGAQGAAGGATGAADALITTTNTSLATSTVTGALVVAGGAGIGGDVWVNGRINSESMKIADTVFDSTLVSVSTTDKTVIDSYSIDQFNLAKYMIQVSEGRAVTANFHAVEILLLVNNAGQAFTNEYGLIVTGPELGTFDADTLADNIVRLYFTPATATVKTIKVLRVSMVS